MSEYPTDDELPVILAALMPKATVTGTTYVWTFEPIVPAFDPYWPGDDRPIPHELAERIAMARVLAALEAAGFYEVGSS